MKQLIIFGIFSIPVIIFSWKSLFDIKSHGFYRFISWECIVWLFSVNYKYWFIDPLSINQIISWVFLIVSAYLVIVSVFRLKKLGKQGKRRDEKTLFEFEKTTELIDTGIYKYIRHPLYSSLLFLTWGIFLKHTDFILLAVAILSSVFLFLTAKCDEKECLNYFGEKYSDYMKRSKRFIPFLI
ncbi:methyltransferase family protein [Bacteroidota bacterium]